MQDGKTHRLTFTSPTRNEKEQIKQGLATYISQKATENLLKDQQILLSKGRRQEVFLLSTQLWKLYQQIHPYRHPYFLGLFLGELSKETLIPSLHCLHHLTKNVNDANKIIVNSEGEQRFLYGQQLENSKLRDLPTKGKQMVIIVNEENDGLGYGWHKVSKTGEHTIKNQKDLGWYLRRGH